MNDNHPAYALQPGARLQEFEILGVLGSGGFGITYLAQDHDLNCRVVIKEYFPRDHVLREQGSSTVRPHSAKDDDLYQYGLQRFQEEARTLASFPEHPNIVSVKRFFNANASAYMVMPYVEGQTFGQWLLANPGPSEEQLLDIFLPVLDGLRAVHQHNYLHRDIKPANIYLRSDGRPLLIDFGAARQALGEHSKSLSVVISEGYAPKEQYSSKGKHGPWTDIYAVGACLWRAVTGQEPPSATDRVEARDDGLNDPLNSAVELGRGRYSGVFLDSIDWALRLLPQERPNTVREWQDRLLQQATPAKLQAQPQVMQPAQVVPTPAEPAIPRTPSAQSTVRPDLIQPSMAKKGELKSLWLIPGAFVFFVALGILFSDQEKPQSQTDRFAEQERLRLVEGAERKKAEEAAPAAFRNQSYTALDANGRPTTPSSGERPHACVRDNTTGLIWEVKTDDGGLRDKDHTYSWYDSKSSDGNPGSANGGMCYRAGRCDTQKYVQDVNAMGLCGYRDWRMPTIDELKGLVVKGREPTIDDLFFPNTPSSYVWSGSPDAGSTSDAWFLNFAYGNAGYNFRSSYQQVRLVRGGQ